MPITEKVSIVNFCYFRPYWRCYYSNTDAVVYVIDSVDRERMGIAKDELMYMLKVSLVIFIQVKKIILKNITNSNLYHQVFH